ncbi:MULTISPECIES: TetR family transcriptional regulator [Vibrio]|uniref:TetR family transcriptional regulator n=1 Tax=Vibrio ostreae TaxID=2841925 RepID=A0A975U7W4_9VIBR|nr:MULTISPECIES: TetR family transcriptional regulator [Vibrio]QXO15494.1 TetR family transcriptional regulator [Vibrio ostreae]WGY45442.1 TetR family transcriptional regulator [Vibrio sp. ABG19]
MPKRSKEDTEITIQTIMDAVVEQLLTLGYDKMSYTTLSQQTGVSRTGISHHFPKKTDFASALDGRMFSLFVEHLDFDNGQESFVSSWMKALDNSEFVAILRLVFQHVVIAERAQEFAYNGLERLYKLADEKLGSGSDEKVEWLIGKSLITMSK